MTIDLFYGEHFDESKTASYDFLQNCISFLILLPVLFGESFANILDGDALVTVTCITMTINWDDQQLKGKLFHLLKIGSGRQGLY